MRSAGWSRWPPRGCQPSDREPPLHLALHDGVAPQAGVLEARRRVMSALDAAGSGAPPGRLYHACVGSGDQLRIFDVWESREALDDFVLRLLRLGGEWEGLDPGELEVRGATWTAMTSGSDPDAPVDHVVQLGDARHEEPPPGGVRGRGERQVVPVRLYGWARTARRARAPGAAWSPEAGCRRRCRRSAPASALMATGHGITREGMRMHQGTDPPELGIGL